MEQTGIAPPQGLTNTQQGMPPQAGGPPMPIDPAAAAISAMGGIPAPAGPDGMPIDPAMAGMAPPPPPPKPPSMIPSDIARLLAEALNKTKLEAAKGLAGYLGDPRGSVNAREADLLRVWRKRNMEVDPLFEKLVNKKSDEEIMSMMYPGRRALIRYGRRTYTEQVAFADHMAKLDNDPRFKDLDTVDEDDEDEYVPPQSDFPSTGEENFEDEVRLPEEEEQEE
jgi:hypothetical protein